MKKSKIIVPALALIAFSTAASITGTVAWFTANRSTTMTVGTYSIASATTGLTYSLTGAIGTTDSSHTSVSFDANQKLTDGSFDHASKLIFAPNQDGSALANTSGIALESASLSNMTRLVKNGTTYLTAATFTLSVSMEFGASGKSQALFVDKANSSFLVSGVAPSKTGKAFRMAVVGTTANVTDTKVLALGDDAEYCKYINSSHTQAASEGTGAAGSFKAGGDSYASKLIAKDTTVSFAADGAETITQAKAKNNYLGLFTFGANSTVTLNFTCVVWYDGTHSEIVDSNITSGLEDVSVQLGIKAVAVENDA